MKKNVVILYNTTVYVYKFRINLIKKIQELGYQVIVVSPKDEYVEKLKEQGIKHININMSQYGMNPIKEIKTSYDIYKIFKKYNPEFSLHYTIKPNIFGGIAAAFTSVKVINNIAGAGKAFSNEESLFAKLISILYKIGLKSSRKIFFQNFDDMNLFLNRKLVKKELAERIPGSGVDLNKYKTSSISTDNTFLFVGRLLKEKGIEYYLEAAKKTLSFSPDAKFFIVGEHEERSEYIEKDKLDKYLENENIIYYGTVSPDKMPEIIDNSSCVVLPSYYREGVPRSLLEAGAMSKVIITTNNVGCKEVVDEGYNGFKCEIKNSDCLHKSMMRYVNLKEEDKVTMSKNSRLKMVKEFDENIVLSKYINIIKES